MYNNKLRDEVATTRCRSNISCGMLIIFYFTAPLKYSYSSLLISIMLTCCDNEIW